MNAYKKIIYALTLITLIIPKLSSQVTDCPWTLHINGNPVIDTFFAAEHLITCDDTISQPKTTIFSAPNINLTPSFNVELGAAFAVDTTGCVAECEAATSVCSDACASPLSSDITPSGRRHVKHQVVISFPDSVDVVWSDIINTGNNKTNVIVNGTFYNLGDTFNLHHPRIDPSNNQSGVLKRCLCDRNVFLYENDNIAFEEGRIAGCNGSGGGVTEEGGYYSLNYILEYNEAFSPDSIADETIVKFKDRANFSTGSDTVMIAILDSGLDPSLLSINDNVLYYNPGPSGFARIKQGFNTVFADTSGWNFVDNNNNLYDDRGHGSLVTLSFLKALNNLNQGAQEINMEHIQILTVKVLNKCGEGTTFSTACGLHYADLKGADVINTSWGLYHNEFQLHRAVRKATEGQTKLVASAGNIGADLDTLEHFPSGYGSVHNAFVGTPNTTAVSAGNSNVFEVAGACRQLVSPCLPQRPNLPLDITSNHRDTIFAEPSRNVEFLLPTHLQPGCEIQGTSYAAPVLSAGVAHGFILRGNNSKSNITGNSKMIHPAKEQWSYFLKNCN